MKISVLTRGKTRAEMLKIEMDPQDMEVFGNCGFHIKRNRSGKIESVSLTRGGRNRTLACHILDTPPGEIGDHIDCNPMNNRRENLRVINTQDSIRNTRSRGGSSEYKGVCWDKRKRKWLASMTIDYKHIHLGYFDDEIDAALAYDEKARATFGEHGRYNFPEANEQSALV